MSGPLVSRLGDPVIPTWQEIWDALEPALLGQSIPTVSSGNAKVYAYGKALECLKETWGFGDTEAFALIRHMNNSYQDGANAIFVTSPEDDLRDLPAFSMFPNLPEV